MRKRLCTGFILLLLFALPVHGADKTPASGSTKSLEQIAPEVTRLLAREKIHNIFDLCRKVQEHGMTWQPSLVAPNDLVGRLDDEQLRLYAGIKLFDVVYAATFMQRQAVSDAVQTIEAIHEKLNLRSYADLSGNFFATLKKAAAEPESVNVQQLLEQMASDYARNIPPLMSNPQSADYLFQALYGFTIEATCVLAYFYEGEFTSFRNAMRRQPARLEWMQTEAELFKTFDRMKETMRIGGETTEKMAVIQKMVDSMRVGSETISSKAERSATWPEITRQAAAIRLAILTPGI